MYYKNQDLTPQRTLNVPQSNNTLQTQLKKMLNQSRIERSRLGKNSKNRQYLEYPRIRDLVAKNMLDEKSDTFIAKFRNMNKRNGVKFRDKIFPPDENSMGNFKNSPIFWKNFQNSFSRILFNSYKKPEEDDSHFFKLTKGLNPYSLTNSKYQNSSLLNVIKCLTTQKGLIKRIFDYKKLQKSGLYSVWLNINGLWKSIIIDDFFPFSVEKNQNQRQNFAFISSKDRELYPVLIEKAFAKYLKSYSNLYNIDRYDQDAFSKFLNCLTGCSITKVRLGSDFSLNKFENSKKIFDEKMDKIWLDIRKCLREDHLIILKFNIRDEKNFNFKHNNCKNFETGEGYVIKDAEIVYNSEGKMDRILKIKNVLSQNSEWRGTWSKKSKNWTYQLRQNLNYFSGSEITSETINPDSEFWISLEDISLVFEHILICKVQPLGMFNSADLIVDFDQGEELSKRKLIKVEIMKDAYYKFEIFLLKGDAEENGELVSRVEETPRNPSGPVIRFLIGKFLKGNFKFVEYKTSKKNFLSTNFFLNDGEYIILVEFNRVCQEMDTATFTTYGDHLTDIGIFTFKNTDGQLPLSIYYNFVEYRILKSYILSNAQEAKTFKGENGENIALKNFNQNGEVFELPLSYLELEDYCFLVIPNRFNLGQIIEAKVLHILNPLFTLKGAELKDGDTQLMKILPQNFEFCYIKNHDFYNFSQHSKTQISW